MNLYTEEEIIELSKQNPGQVYVSDNDGRVAIGGMMFKSEQEAKRFIGMHRFPLVRFLIRVLAFFSFLKRKK